MREVFRKKTFLRIKKKSVGNSCLTMHRRQRNHNSQSEEISTLKWRENQLTESRFALVLHIIGWEGGVRFLNQSRMEEKQNQSYSGYFQ